MTERFLHPTPRRKRQQQLYNNRSWKHARLAALERDLYVCQVPRRETGKLPPDAVCGKPATLADHIVRPEEGGAPYELANLRAACRSCNLRRHDVRYFRQKVDAAAAGQPLPAAPARAPLTAPLANRTRGPLLDPLPSSPGPAPDTRPASNDAAFSAWAWPVPSSPPLPPTITRAGRPR